MPSDLVFDITRMWLSLIHKITRRDVTLNYLSAQGILGTNVVPAPQSVDKYLLGTKAHLDDESSRS